MKDNAFSAPFCKKVSEKIKFKLEFSPKGALKMFKIFASCLLVCGRLAASTIPSYSIAAIDSLAVRFSNDAIFKTEGWDIDTLQEWVAGDDITIRKNSSYFPPELTIKDGVPFVLLSVTLHNATKNSDVTSSLYAEPQVGSTTISAIDIPSGQVLLSDAVTWRVHDDDRIRLEFWQVGDFVLIGENTGMDQSSFDAVILNASNHTHARAKEL